MSQANKMWRFLAFHRLTGQSTGGVESDQNMAANRFLGFDINYR